MTEELTLSDNEISAKPIRHEKVGHSYFEMEAGEKLEFKEHNEKFFDQTVPSGKTWIVHLSLEITEEDA